MHNCMITLVFYRGMPIAVSSAPRRVAIVYWNPKDPISCADRRTGSLLRLRWGRLLLRIRNRASREDVELGTSEFLCRYDCHEPCYRPGSVRNLCERVGFLHRRGYPD